MSLWCRLLPQVEMRLNMVRLCQSNSKMPIYTALEEEFNYNKILLTLLGTKVINFKLSSTRQLELCIEHVHR